MIHVAIVEDDSNYQKELKQYLSDYEKEHAQAFRVDVFSDGDEITQDYREDYNIIFMDIEMKFLDGMTAAEYIRKVDQEVVIIFITNMPQYVMQGYKVEALDYILKPISYYQFAQTLERAISRMSRRTREYLTVAIKGGFQKIDLSQIRYIEVLDHDLIFHLRDEQIVAKGSMRDAEEKLKEKHFFRCNKCEMVNLSYVDGIVNNDANVDGNMIQVSRSKKKAFLNALNDYMNEVRK